MMTKILFVVCPLCGLHRKLNKNGMFAIKMRKALAVTSRAAKYNPDKETRFDTVNIREEPFISVRVRGHGARFEEVETLTMEEALINEETRERAIELLKQVRKQCEIILEELDRLGITSS